jgi:hypothetical protein
LRCRRHGEPETSTACLLFLLSCVADAMSDEKSKACAKE